MVRRLNHRDANFERDFQDLVAAKRQAEEDVEARVAEILADVERRGDQAVVEYTRRFDRVTLAPESIAFEPAEIERAVAACDAAELAALRLAHRRIEDFHRRQLPAEERYIDAAGVELGSRWTPIEAVGIYVPGGLAAYPSSVLMNAVPARVAGVERLVMVVPTPDGAIKPLVLAAAALAGVTEIYRLGGAQAIGALAYGTASIAPVDKIVGPGNAYVASAKRAVFGRVGIDLIAGPSEILVLADRDNDPSWIAADLLAQAEHDETAQAILITDDADFADAVVGAVEGQLRTMARADIAGASWRAHGAAIVVDDLDQGADLINRIAPEHVELAIAEPDRLATRVRHAGAIFLGRHTPEAIGDYIAGPNHVLPTGGAARFASGLSVLDFVKRTSIVRCDGRSLARIGPAAATLARAEGLGGHAHSIDIRLNAPRS